MAFKKKADLSNAQAFKFEKVKQSLEGYYMGTTIIQIDGSDVKKHLFQTSKGLVSVLGQAHLGNQLETIEVGTMIRATYTGSRKAKKGTMKLYDLEYDEDDRIEADGLSVASQPQEESVEEEASEEYAEEQSDEEYVEEQEEVQAAPPVRRPAPPASPAKRPVGNVSPEQKAKAQALLGKR